MQALEEWGEGPKTLKERLTALGGSLSVDSSDRGSVIEAVVPRSGAS